MKSTENENMSDPPLDIQRYQLGLMTPDEEVAFEHSLSKSQEMRDELQQANEGLTAMYENLSINTPLPRRDLKKKIISKATGVEPSPYDVEEFVMHGTALRWEKTSVQGIQFKKLYLDDDGRTMLLAKFEPGAVFPPHHRLNTEECYVISGDFWADGEELGAGDFIAGKKGFEPIPIYSKGGCELLLKLEIPKEIIYQ